jgi:hypothetical protein
MGRPPGKRRGARVVHLIGYIDPGSGSLVFQALIATVIAVPFFFRQQIGRALHTIRRGPTATPVDSGDGSRKQDA